MKTRREFIGCSVCTLFVIGCGDKTNEPITSSDETGMLPDEDTNPEFDPCETTASDGWAEVLLNEHPSLQPVSGYKTINVNGKSMVIAHVSEGCYAAVASSCTHEGGEIYYSAERQQFSCLLHAATFQLDGEWTLGQITSNLESYLVSKEGDKLLIDV